MNTARNEQRSVLHVFNGDCAADAWKRSVHSDDRYIVWRECYLEGPLPPPDTPREKFARIRAEFLHTCVPQYSVETLTRFQCGLEETLQSMGAGDGIMLWFDDCMFDMVMLARILFLLEKSSAEIHLICENRILGNETDLYRMPWNGFRKLDPETIFLYADAWRAITLGGDALEKLLRSKRMDTETVLKRGLLRYTEDHPLDGSPGLSERKLLKLTADGIHEFRQLFRTFNASEGRPFMGDTMCERMLQSLEKRGCLMHKTDSENNVFYYPAEK